MTPIRTLLLIMAFLVLTVGSFVWYVATWDAAAEEPLTFTFPQLLPSEARNG